MRKNKIPNNKSKGAKQVSAKDILKMYDQNAGILSMFVPKTKDFTTLIEVFEAYLNRIKITKEIGDEIKKECSGLSDDAFFAEFDKRVAQRIEPTNSMTDRVRDEEFFTKLCALPDNKGRRFFELMADLEDWAMLPMDELSKKERRDNWIKTMEDYVSEIKAVNKPFVPKPVDENQTVIFKVMFKHRKGIWRKIELKALQTLENLHDAIQGALDWDNDHLYSFFMDNKFNSRDDDMEYTSPHEPEGRKTADVPVGIFGFEKGQKFAYLFDFGDEHRFEIEVIDLGTVQEGKKYPVLLESKGKSPEQYPDWEEDE